MIDEVIELTAALTAAVRAYLYAQDQGYDTTDIRRYLEDLLHECHRRNL